MIQVVGFPRMTIKKHTAQNSSGTRVPDETGPLIGQPSVKRTLKAEPYEMGPVFLTSLPPREAHKWVDETFSLEQMVLALSQGVSNNPDSILNKWSHSFLQSL